MSIASAKIAELRGMIAPKRKEVLPFTKFSPGIPRGAISEISGPHGCGKTELVLKLIAENLRLHVAWIEDKFTAYPRAFPQYGVHLNRVLFAEAEDQAIWTAHQMLRSGIFGIVVLSTGQLEGSERVRSTQERQLELRRLQLAAEQSNSSLILLSETPTIEGAWPINLQLTINRNEVRRIK